MRRYISLILFVIILAGFGPQGQAFWLWSPKAKKWRNPKYSPLASPQAQFDYSLEFYKNEKYKEALIEFRKLMHHFPDSKQAPDAQFYIGMCFEKLGNPYQAFKEYQKVVDSYPYSDKINEIIVMEYRIGEYFLNKEKTKWLGVVLDEFFEHPSIEIFGKVIENAPYSESAHAAQYKLGLLYRSLARYEESVESFKELVENYPESKWAEPAKYQLALTSAEASLDSDYDQELSQEAKNRFQEFVSEHPDAEISQEVEEELAKLRDKEAQKYFDIGQFYYKDRDYKSAEIYYDYVIKHFPKTLLAERSKQRLEEIEERLR